MYIGGDSYVQYRLIWKGVRKLQKPILDKSVLAKWLGDVIRTEMEKPVEEINWELVDECEAYLAELYSDIRISEEQMRQNIANIKNKSSNVKTPSAPRRMPRWRRMIVVVCIISGILACGVSAYAFIPGFREMIREVLNLPVGESIDDEDGITFTNLGESKKYQNIDQLVLSEKLDILYPHNLPIGWSIKSITAISGEVPQYLVSFSDNQSSILISHGEIDISSVAVSAEVLPNGYNYIAYLTDDGSIYSAVVINDGWTYYISTSDKTQLITLFENFY